MNYFLKSDRLGFRLWAEDDLPLAMQIWGDPEVTKMISGPFSAAAVQARLATEIAQMHACVLQCWRLFLLEGDCHVGCAGLRPYRVEDRIYSPGKRCIPVLSEAGGCADAGRTLP